MRIMSFGSAVLSALLALSGCASPIAAGVITAGLGVIAQGIGVVDQTEGLVKDTWFDLHPQPKACPAK